jgi:aminoglycoside phosphotransferase (APT) family kinase protein
VTTLPDTADPSVVEAILGEAGHDQPASLTLLMHGDEFDTWKVGDSMVVKFARTDEIAGKVECERRATTLFRQRLGELVPALVFESDPVSSFPYPFLGWEPVRGVQAQSLSGTFAAPPRSAVPTLVEHVASVIGTLHAIPTRAAREHGLETEDASEERPFTPDSATVEHVRSVVGDAIDRFLDLPSPLGFGRSVTCHRDLKGEHIFLSPSLDRVKSVIDWADACVTDPALDRGHRDLLGTILRSCCRCSDE